MNKITASPGVSAALGAALLFGAATPIAKELLGTINPLLLAGLLYLGSGIGLTLFHCTRSRVTARVSLNELPWLVGSILTGGVAGPVLLLLGLANLPASTTSLLLNGESVFTVLIAWLVFREYIGQRIVVGIFLIAAGGVVLSKPWQPLAAPIWPVLFVLAACLAWAIDNNLTQRVSLADASWIASLKGWASGSVNLILGIAAGAQIPSFIQTGEAMIAGLLTYGVSLALYIVSLRHLGTARTGAYFATAPFFGVLLALTFGDPVTVPLLAATALMGLGVWLHLTEHHDHEHIHEPLEHTHEHIHDEHHQHEHDWSISPDTRHTHFHRHRLLTHRHPHFPDVHHRHEHSKQ